MKAAPMAEPMEPMGMKRKPVMKPGSRMMAGVLRKAKPKPVFSDKTMARLKGAI